MRNILVFVESRFPVKKHMIKEAVNHFLDTEGFRGKLEVSVSIVGDRKMKKVNKTYREKDETTTVLAFALSESKQNSRFPEKAGFISAPDGVLLLGDVLISYPQAVARAGEDEMLVEDKLKELLIHGLTNLIGKGEKNSL